MSSDHTQNPDLSEASVWKQVSGEWRQLFGAFFQRGLSIEWHDFQLNEDMDWAPSFHPGSLEICLNFSGSAWLQDGTMERELPAGTSAAYTVRPEAPRARRRAGSLHRFITVELTPAYLRAHCADQIESLKDPLKRFATSDGKCPPFLEIGQLTTPLLALRGSLLDPPVPTAARDAWYLAKAAEILSHIIYRDDEPGTLFCQRHHRQNRERVERARYLIERDLENPASLEMLAADIGCSTFHLSRIFAEETGMSIPKFLRTRRIERAGELLRAGKMSVTAVAMAVGYSSLSAFNKAFVEQMGCCPGLYPAVSIRGRKPGANREG